MLGRFNETENVDVLEGGVDEIFKPRYWEGWSGFFVEVRENIVSHHHREARNTEAVITVKHHYGTTLPIEVEGNRSRSRRRQYPMTVRQDGECADKVEEVSFPRTRRS